MPTFPEVTGDSRRMNSNHGVATVIDSYIKGIRNFDLSAAYEACKLGITEKTLAPWSGIKGGEIQNSIGKTDIYRHWHRENKKQLTKYTHLKNANR